MIQQATEKCGDMIIMIKPGNGGSSYKLFTITKAWRIAPRSIGLASYLGRASKNESLLAT